MDFSNARAKSLVTDDGDSGMDSDSRNNLENSDSTKPENPESKTSDSKPEIPPTYQDSYSSLEYGASAIRNTLRLLVRIEAKGKDDIGMSCRPGAPLTNSGHATLKIHALLAGAYIQLQLQNWVVALEYCDQILVAIKASCSDDFYLTWLCHTYQATAYLNLNKPSKASEILTATIKLVMQRDGFRDWQANLYDSNGVSTSYGRGGKGGVCAAKVNVSNGTKVGQSLLLANINEWRVLNLSNLAAVYCVQGKLTQCGKLLQHAQSFLRTLCGVPLQRRPSDKFPNRHASSLAMQQFDSVRNYLSLTVDV